MLDISTVSNGGPIYSTPAVMIVGRDTYVYAVV
jgi:hypothetical protein